MTPPRRPLLPPFQAALLDLDGLVLDSEASYRHAWQAAAREAGATLPEAFCRGLFGQHADAVAAALREALGPSFDQDRFCRAAERHWRRHLAQHGLAPMPGLDRLLAACRRHAIPYALATNSDAPYARECLELAGLAGEFPVMVTRDQVRHGKPAPDLFLEAARRLGIPPALCLGLEDSAPGLEAARAAGTIVVLVQRRGALRRRLRPLAQFACASLNEVAAWLEASAAFR
ncbi:HAD family hydrolase [Candidatus Methylocalor cossyra]|uniref:Fructose-1-phosphate phosphatase YqaB n=1 Tax=Candidatus Methylocalor cossyra TaxID=3108543 RepID=A0ABM9NEQ9_9GAMM